MTITKKKRDYKGMACFSCPASCQIRCSTGRDWNDRNRPKLGNFKISGAASRGPRATKPDVLPGKSSGVSATFTSVAAVSENGYISGEQERQKNTPTKKQLVDSHRQGVIIEGGVGYRQTVFIRSYEVGADKTVTIESILNLFQVIS